MFRDRAPYGRDSVIKVEHDRYARGAEYVDVTHPPTLCFVWCYVIRMCLRVMGVACGSCARRMLRRAQATEHEPRMCWHARPCGGHSSRRGSCYDKETLIMSF